MNNQLLQNYINYINTWKNNIFRVDIHLIWGCNFKCIMCDNWKKKVELNFSYEELQRFIIILKKKYNCNYIRFHGQEPSLYEKLEDLIVFTKKLWIKVAIKTNWWLLNDKRLVKLLIWWLDELYLSIDSANPEIHDKIRWVKWSFLKNISLIEKSKKINPNLKIYINSVVMKLNFKDLDKMLDLWKKYNLDRISFVFLNDKNRKDINDINLSKEEFNNFFKNQILNIFKKSKILNIPVDFSPFLRDLSWKNTDFIISELENNFWKYKFEIEAFYEWNYWKYFYDSYWCFWPIDHSSINFNWDMYSCCVVERDSSNSIWNILKDDIQNLWNSEKYKKYRENSNEYCSYSSKCASNFYTRKSLFKNIYLKDDLYNKNNPIAYYRYLKEFQNESEIVKNKIKLEKLKNILLYFFDNLEFYRNLLENSWIKRENLENINSLDFIQKLPLLDKNILIENYTEIEKLSIWKNILNWKTSWNSGLKLDFFYPLDFKRYIKQIVIFSKEFWFTYNDSYFSLTPINCNQTFINSIKEPDYVRKIYLPTTNKLDFSLNYFLSVFDVFKNNKNIKYLHADSKYLLYIILWFKKYNLDLPKFDWVSLSYSYTNKSLKEFIAKEFNALVSDNYWCSEVWPISLDINWKEELFWDNLILEEINSEIIVSDLDNIFFPFIRYKNWDLWQFNWEKIEIFWKNTQILNKKTLKDIDNFFSEKFSDILIYQFNQDNLEYISIDFIDENKLVNEIKKYFWKSFKISKIWENEYLKIGDCSKFKYIM